MGNRLRSACYAQSRSLKFNVIRPRRLALPQPAPPKSCPCGNVHLSPRYHPLPSRTSGPPFCLTALELQSVNWQATSNRQAHHTDRFSSRELILRRGQSFSFSFSLNRGLGDGESLGFIVSTGPYPSESARTKAVFPVSNGTSRGGWSAQLVSKQDNILTISMASPVNAPVGVYTLSAQISSRGKDFILKLGTFILLFNPWLPEDGVFMNNHAEREEYVQEDAGIIYVGSTNRIGMVGWNFGQFEEGILNICLSILDHSLNFRRDPATDVARRSDPKYVGRVLSAMVNGNDENGVLSGNWSGNYTGGLDPRNWNGSVEILKEWKKSGFRPVRYGQCWVFAGTLNTVLRCFGIPSRVVTNFNSAHDTDRNLSVDVYYDPYGNPIEKGSDSVWNFHVWNEGWFVRTDLGPSYNGWQVLDATPQERSQGVFQCGPASVAAVREGDVNLDFDMPFVFAEVNADRITWIYDASNNTQKQNASDTHSIGRYISTKAVGSNSRVDITEKYKYPEGSSQERQVFQKALGKLKPHAAFGATSVGKEVNMALLLKNLTSDMKTVTVNMTAWTIVYNGTLVHEVWKDSITISLDPKEGNLSCDEVSQLVSGDRVVLVLGFLMLNPGPPPSSSRCYFCYPSHLPPPPHSESLFRFDPPTQKGCNVQAVMPENLGGTETHGRWEGSEEKQWKAGALGGFACRCAHIGKILQAVMKS
uniref:protein-glutamine gamma-glutamyltransferase n=1 Tax=Ursus americanus TaxID=9643 RepID=A0A452QY98_URSAM